MFKHMFIKSGFKNCFKFKTFFYHTHIYMDLWKKYKIPILKRLRTDMTFTDGINGKPTRLPQGFKNDEMLIIRYLTSGLSYSDVAKLQIGGARSAAEIWTIYKSELIERLQNDDTYNPKKLDDLPKEFIQDKTHAEWVVRSYLLGGIKTFKDISNGTVYKALGDFLEIKDKKFFQTAEQKKERERVIKEKAASQGLEQDKIDKLKPVDLRNILSYCGLDGCRKMQKGIEITMPGILEPINKYHESMVYDGEKIRIYTPKTAKQAIVCGAGTTWCTAKQDPEHNRFDQYYADGPIYTIVPKKPKYAKEKYQISYTSNMLHDEKDVPMNYYDFMTEYTEALEFVYKTPLVKAYKIKHSPDTLPLLIVTNTDEKYVIYIGQTVFEEDPDYSLKALFVKKESSKNLSFGELLEFIHLYGKDTDICRGIGKYRVHPDWSPYNLPIMTSLNDSLRLEILESLKIKFHDDYEFPQQKIVYINPEIFIYIANHLFIKNDPLAKITLNLEDPVEPAREVNILIQKGNKRARLITEYDDQRVKATFSEYKKDQIGIKTLDGYVIEEDGPAMVIIGKHKIDWSKPMTRVTRHNMIQLVWGQSKLDEGKQTTIQIRKDDSKPYYIFSELPDKPNTHSPLRESEILKVDTWNNGKVVKRLFYVQPKHVNNMYVLYPNVHEIIEEYVEDNDSDSQADS